MKKHTRLISFKLCVLATALVMLSLVAGSPLAATTEMDLPKKLASLSNLLQLTQAEVQALNAGQPVSKILASGTDAEVAVLGVMWINAPLSKYIRAIQDIEHLEHGKGFQATRRISDPPRLEDFAALQLPDVDIHDLKKCRLGDCGVNLDEYAINRIQKEIDWSKPTATADVNALMRQVALRYVTAYQQAGNKGLPVYRDNSDPTYSAQEFAAMINAMPLLRQQEPALRQYLLDYPKAKLPNANSFLYWQKVDFGLKPVVRINHVVTTQTADHAVVASKQIYASHYFMTAVEVRELIPDPSRGEGFWFVDVSRGRSESLNGLKGRIIRGRVEKETLNGLTKGMEATRSFLEKTR
jgi:hypothetical protein